jgi:hypothetical protein
MKKVVEATAFTAKLLTLPTICDRNACDIFDRLPEDLCKLTAILPDYSVRTLDLDNPIHQINKVAYIYIKGAVSDSLLNKLVMLSFNLRNVKIIVVDSSKLLINEQTFEKLKLMGASFAVRHSINLAAIAINPMSAYGISFDKNTFIKAVRERVCIPVYNVLDEGTYV